MEIPYFLLVVAVSIAPVLIAGTLLRVIKYRSQRFINPITQSLRRPPGLQLLRQLGREQINVGFDVVEIFLPGVIPMLMYTLTMNRPDSPIQTTLIAVVLVSLFVWEVYAVGKLVRRFKRIKKVQLGYECELAVGQALNLLMQHGFQVFHDVQAEKFNIDHIVVGPRGVFAVETKGRSKTLSGDGTKQYHVTVRRDVLVFPNGFDSESIPQAARQARWVSTWLSQSTGQTVSARPLLVLPGWYVETLDHPEVPVIASGYIQSYFLKQSAQRLTDKEISQIVYQIDQKVRDVPPGDLIRPLPST